MPASVIYRAVYQSLEDNFERVASNVVILRTAGSEGNDGAALGCAQALEDCMRARLTHLYKEIFQGSHANLPQAYQETNPERVTVSCRNASTGEVTTFTWRFGDPAAATDDIEAALTAQAPALVGRNGNAVGDVVKVSRQDMGGST